MKLQLPTVPPAAFARACAAALLVSSAQFTEMASALPPPAATAITAPVAAPTMPSLMTLAAAPKADKLDAAIKSYQKSFPAEKGDGVLITTGSDKGAKATLVELEKSTAIIKLDATDLSIKQAAAAAARD